MQIYCISGKNANFFMKNRPLTAEFETHHSNGDKLFTSIATVFARLDGGFGGEDAPKKQIVFPEREPDTMVDAKPSADQWEKDGIVPKLAARDPDIEDPYQAISLYLVESGTPVFVPVPIHRCLKGCGRQMIQSQCSGSCFPVF